MPFDHLPSKFNVKDEPIAKVDTADFPFEKKGSRQPLDARDLLNAPPETIIGAVLQQLVQDRIAGQLSPTSGLLDVYASRLKEASPGNEQIVERFKEKIESGSLELLEKIVQNLPPNKTHFFLEETRFQINPHAIEKIKKNHNRKDFDQLSKNSGYSSTNDALRSFLIDGDINIGNVNLSLADIRLLLRSNPKDTSFHTVGRFDPNPEEKNRIQELRQKLDGLKYGYPAHLHGQLNKQINQYLEFVYDYSIYHHFLDIKDGQPLQSLFRAITARSDLIALSATPGSDGEKSLQDNGHQFLATGNLLTPEKAFEAQSGDSSSLSELLKHIASGDITLTMVEIKTQSRTHQVRNNIAPDGREVVEHVPFRFLTEEQEVKDRYLHDVTHTWQAIVQFLELAGRVNQDPLLSSLSEITQISKLSHTNADHSKTMREFKTLLNMFNNTQTLLARMYWGVVNPVPGAVTLSGIDPVRVTNSSPNTDCVKFSPREIRQALSKFVKRLVSPPKQP